MLIREKRENYAPQKCGAMRYYKCCLLLYHCQVVHTSLQAMVQKDVRPSDPELTKPEEEEVEKVREKERSEDKRVERSGCG